ncbi:MAG: DUF898 family protein [Pseudobdellovibrionaceae bacterium]|nr:DUF898 family protein [Pseudobdellovibrionaceae bacterium]
MNKEDLGQQSADVSKTAAKSSKKLQADGKVPVYKPSYIGSVAELYKIFLVNVLLNICTLGIYSFWGKTRIRKYMASHTVLAGNRMEYTGTGKELFVGFFKSLLIYWPVAFAMQIPAIYIFGLIGLICLMSLAMYMSLRYRLSRTRWKGIRFILGGHAGHFLKLALKRTFLNFISLGYKVAESDVIKWDYIGNRMGFGETKFAYKGDSTRLQKTNLKTIAIILIYTVISFIPMITTMTSILHELKERKPAIERQAQPSHMEETYNAQTDLYGMAAQSPNAQKEYIGTGRDTGDAPDVLKDEDHEGATRLGVSVIFGLVWVATIFLVIWVTRLWYKAALWKEQFRGLTIEDIRFKCTMTGGGLLKLSLVNILMIVFSLGLLMPFVYQRNIRYYLGCLKVGGNLNALEVKQIKSNDPDGTGDSLAADLSMDFGF